MNVPIQHSIFKRPMPLGEICQNVHRQRFRSPLPSRKRGDSFALSETALKQLAVPIPHYRNCQDFRLLGKRKSRPECYMPLSQNTDIQKITPISGISPFVGRKIHFTQFPLNFVPGSLKVQS